MMLRGKVQSLCEHFSASTLAWFQRYVEAGFGATLALELADLWMEKVFEIDEDWFAQVLIDWGSSGMQDVIGSLLDGEAE